MNSAANCPSPVSWPGRVVEAIRLRFTMVSIRAADSRVLTVDDVDPSAVRAVMITLWDTGHEVLKMTTTPAGAGQLRGAE